MIVFSFLLLLFIGLTQRSIHRNRFISPILAMSLTIYILCWNAFPFLYSTFMSDRTQGIISNPTYQKVIAIQFISVISILTLLNILTIFRPKPQRAPCPQRKDYNANMILILLVIMFIFSLFANIYSINTAGFTFLERARYVVSDSNKENAVGALLSALNSYTIPFAIACIFSGIRTIRDNQWIMCLSITIIAVHIGFMITFGIRSFIFMPIVLIVIYWKVYALKLGRITKIAAGVLMFMFIFAAPYLSRSLRTIRAMESYRMEDVLVAPRSERFSSVGEYTLSALDDIYTKFSSFEQGTALLEIQGISRIGTSLITSVLASPIPRMLYPTKPVPFSSNGEYSGVPYYLVPSLRRSALSSNVVPIPPSTIALWELGYMGLFQMIVFNVLNLFFINIFLKSELLLFRTIGFFMLTLPTFEFLISPTGLIIKEALRILVLIFFIKLLLLIGSSMRRVLGLQKLNTSLKPSAERIVR